MSGSGYLGCFVGVGEAGERVEVKVMREGRSWVLDGPGGAERAHPCRETLYDLRYEVELVFNLTGVRFERRT
ncbi:MAG: hypothetical protein BGN86_11720 [Caulobacterales bacterium 68-7]|mgnify:FL=1|nr:MAG: hypothetical protein BGN86_11720 [Caulobacterales bacterium 68-7]